VVSLDIGSETDTSWLETLGDTLLPVKPLDAFFSSWPQIVAQARQHANFRLVVVGGGAAGVELALAAQHAFTSQGVRGTVNLVASDAGLLPGHSNGVQSRLQRIAERAGVRVHLARGVGTQDGVLLADGQLVPSDRVLAATGARASAWLGRSQLTLDAHGYVVVDKFHRSVSHPNVFAAGDVCSRSDVTLARSGVHAVRAGPVLAANLLAALNGGPLRAYRPRARSLYLISCGPRYAVASWGRWSAQGAWVWLWKDWIDRRFIAKFSHARASIPSSLQGRAP